MVRHVAVLILYNDKGEILLQHRAKNAERSPGMWGFFGGGIERGETPEAAIRREIKEELDYESHDTKFVRLEYFGRGLGEMSEMHIFAEKFNGAQKLFQHKGDEMRWFSISEIDNLVMIPHDKMFLKKIWPFLQAMFSKNSP